MGAPGVCVFSAILCLKGHNECWKRGAVWIDCEFTASGYLNEAQPIKMGFYTLDIQDRQPLSFGLWDFAVWQSFALFPNIVISSLLLRPKKNPKNKQIYWNVSISKFDFLNIFIYLICCIFISARHINSTSNSILHGWWRSRIRIKARKKTNINVHLYDNIRCGFMRLCTLVWII